MADKKEGVDADLLEEITDEDITLSTNELDDILQAADFTDEAVDTASGELDLSAGDDDQLEKYGIWVKVKPEPLPSGQQEPESFELSDLGGDEDLKLTREEEDLLAELEEELDEGPGVAETELAGDVQELAELDVSDFEDNDTVVAEELPEFDDLSIEDLVAEPTLPMAEDTLELQDIPAGDLSDDLPELEMEEETGELEVSLSADEDSSFGEKPPRGRSEERTAFDSSGILLRIENELESIKREIFELKRELAGISRSPEGISAVEVEPAPADNTGFFTEEEDETIALTGDELDNILNNADVLEETPEAPLEVGDLEEDPELAAPADLLDPSAAEESGGSPSEGLLIDQEDLLDLDSPLEEEEISIELDGPETAESGAAELEMSEPTELEMSEPTELEMAEPIELEMAEPIELETSESIDLEMAEPIELELEPEQPADAEAGLSLEDDFILEPADEDEPESVDLPELEMEAGSPAEELVLDEPLEEVSGRDGIPMDEILDEISPPVEHFARPEPVEDLLETLEAEGQRLEPLPFGDASDNLLEELPASGGLAGGGLEEELVLEEESEASSQVEDLEPLDLPSREVPAAPTGALEVEDLPAAEEKDSDLSGIKSDIRSVLAYLDNLLGALPEEKILEFAHSEYYGTYKKLFEELGLTD